MGQVTAVAEATIDATPEQVLAALADYREVRPTILPEQYTDYAVLEGGVGSGTVVSWRFHATEKRVRDVVADVTVEGDLVTETDRNSTMVTTFAVTPEGDGTRVVVTTSWQGAGGAKVRSKKPPTPPRLERIHGALLETLAARLAG
jgi:hypothetical protein